MVTTYFKNLVADNVWHTEGASALPSTYYLAMSTTEPQEDGSGVTEPSQSSGYRRVAISALSAASNGEVHNTARLAWPKVNSNEGVVGYWAIYDSADHGAGNLLMGGAFVESKHLESGTAMLIDINGLTLKVLGA